MSVRSVYIADGEIRVRGAIGEAMWWSELEPFTRQEPQGTPRFYIDVHLSTRQDAFPNQNPSRPQLIYTRHDLRFYATGNEVWAYYDGQQAGFLAILELALYWAVENQGGLLLHAAAGVIDDLACVMPGPSGTGKSTAAHGGFDRVLSDERVIILPDEIKSYRVWGTPFWSDGRRLPMDCGSAPLGWFARLHHGTHPSMASMDAGALAAWVMRSVISYDYDPQARHRALDRACAMVEFARRISITYPKEGSWVSSTLNPTGLTL